MVDEYSSPRGNCFEISTGLNPLFRINARLTQISETWAFCTGQSVGKIGNSVGDIFLDQYCNSQVTAWSNSTADDSAKSQKNHRQYIRSKEGHLTGSRQAMHTAFDHSSATPNNHYLLRQHEDASRLDPRPCNQLVPAHNHSDPRHEPVHVFDYETVYLIAGTFRIASPIVINDFSEYVFTGEEIRTSESCWSTERKANLE